MCTLADLKLQLAIEFPTHKAIFAVAPLDPVCMLPIGNMCYHTRKCVGIQGTCAAIQGRCAANREHVLPHKEGVLAYREHVLPYKEGVLPIGNMCCHTRKCVGMQGRRATI